MSKEPSKELRAAIDLNDMNKAKSLIEAGAKLPRKSMAEAIMLAAMQGRDPILRLLVEKLKPPIRSNAVLMAAARRQHATLQLLAEAGADMSGLDDDNPRRRSILQNVVGYGDAEALRVLIRHGAHVNTQDVNGTTPLMELARCMVGMIDAAGGKLCLRTLLELGADAELKDFAGNDAVDYYRFYVRQETEAEDPEVTRILRDANAVGDLPTCDLLFAKDIAAMKRAIARGADVNRIPPPNQDLTPLCMAAQAGDLKRVDLLLEAGADVNKAGRSGTPLLYAAEHGHLAVVKQLIAAGADVSLRQTRAMADELEPMNAYEIAGWARKRDVVKYLKSIGADKTATPSSLNAGVHLWEEFWEIMVKSDASRAAQAIAEMIGGEIAFDVFGKTVKLTKKCYVVARPKEMSWCNVFQVAPPMQRWGDDKNIAVFCKELAEKCGSAVLSARYNDASDAAQIFRYEPGTRPRRAQLASEKLQKLAEEERFVAAAFSPDVDAGKVRLDFGEFGEAAFDGIAWICA